MDSCDHLDLSKGGGTRLCGYVLLCVYIHVNEHARMSVCKYMHARSMHTRKHVCLNICAYMLVWGWLCLCLHMGSFGNVCAHTSLEVHTYDT